MTEREAITRLAVVLSEVCSELEGNATNFQDTNHWRMQMLQCREVLNTLDGVP